MCTKPHTPPYCGRSAQCSGHLGPHPQGRPTGSDRWQCLDQWLAHPGGEGKGEWSHNITSMYGKVQVCSQTIIDKRGNSPRRSPTKGSAVLSFHFCCHGDDLCTHSIPVLVACSTCLSITPLMWASVGQTTRHTIDEGIKLGTVTHPLLDLKGCREKNL